LIDFQLPKYYTVKRAIIEHIDDEVYRIGEMIPSERELMQAFEVSRITIRKAVDELEREGYLYRVQGKGTFVKGDQNSQNLISLTSCTQDIERLGMKPSRRVLGSAVIPADKKRQHALNLKEGEPVFRLERVIYADDEPINLTTTYLAYRYLEGIEKHDFAKESLYGVLEKRYGITIKRAVRRVEAVIAHGEVPELLGMEEGVPLLLFQCTTYGEIAGRECPIETFKCYYRSDKFSFYINQIR
jgi:GntR family transcriptional regulator